MQRIVFILVLLGAAAAGARAEPAAPRRGALRLRNGDRLTGALERLDVENGWALFQPEYARGPVAFQLGAIEGYRSAGAGAGEPGAWAFALANGDRLSGALVALDDRALTLDTPAAGRLTVNRADLRTATHHIGGALIFQGPGEATEWPAHSGSVKFADGGATLGPRAHIGRRLERLPRRMRVEFDVAGDAAARLTVQLYGSTTAIMGTTKPHYQLIVASQHRVTLAHLSPQSGTRRFATSAPLGEASSGMAARIALCADLDAYRFEAFVNGQSVAVWEDGVRPAADGTAVTLMNFSSGAVTVSNLEVREWSGFPTPPPADGSSSAVLLKLNNGDAINGAALAISGGTARIETAFGDLAIPVERVASIAFPGPTAPATEPKGVVEVHLRDGARMTLKLQPAAAGEIVGESAALGRVRVPMDAVLRMEWNPPQKAGQP